MQLDFARVARLSPAKAAKIIVRGVERGKGRVLVGADAHAVDVLQRLVPVRYFDVVERLGSLLRPS
jgi:hypothetical protein